MTGILVRPTDAIVAKSPDEVFFCPEESHFYSHCLERLVFHNCPSSHAVIEFGCGDGSPVINSLLRSQFQSVIYGYELNPSACQVANDRIDRYQLQQHYIVQNASFFDAPKPEAHYLIANPPYIPAPDDNLRMPLLHGGLDGATITNQLISQGYPAVMVLISSYSNPVGTINHAVQLGYTVADFLVTPLQFGYYSSEPKVRAWIAELQKSERAFFSKNIYFLAGVLFKQRSICSVDLSNEFIKTMTSLG